MRLTIERIRTFILAAAILLIAAIAVSLGFSRWRHSFSGRDIPQRLGVNIQQEANGVTYTQAHGGHTIFKIHASRVVQLRNNHATLHDVVIELYGKDGARVDRIQGAEFEYDQQTSTATAAGPVTIELARPAAEPAAGSKPPKPGPNDQIRIRTSGVTFTQSTGIVTTSQRVEFASGQGAGSAVGASYDSDLGYLVLNRDVELKTLRGSEPVVVHAEHAELNRDTQICVLHQATAQSRGEQATATEARISLRQDGSVERLNATSGLTISTQQGSKVAAPTGVMEFTARNQPHRAHFEGGVTLDSASGLRTVHGTAPTMDIDFSSTGDLRHARLERGVEVHSEEQAQNGSAAATQLLRTWHSPVADIDFRNSGGGRVEPALLRGTEGVVVSSETRRSGSAPVPSRLAADDVTAQFGPRSTLTSMTGLGHASIEQTAASGTHQTATGDRLEARFVVTQIAAAHQSDGRSSSDLFASQQQASQLQTAQLDGHIVLIDQPAPKPGSPAQTPMRATSGRALYEATDTTGSSEQWLHLTVNPRVTDGGIDLTADKIDVSQSSGDAFAHGNVKATWVSEKSPGTQQSTPQNVALGGNTPAHIIAAEAQLHQATGEATFRRHARLWQDQNSISAPVIILNRPQQTLAAQAANSADPVQAALLSAETSPLSAKSAAAGVHTPTVIRVRAGDLLYSAQGRKAVLHATPLSRVTAQTGDVESTSDQLELYLTPTGNQSPSAAPFGNGQGQIDRVVAIGHVDLASQGRRGTGSQLVYTAQTGNYVLTGTPSAPPRMTDPQRGSVTGHALLFSSRDDSVSIEGESQPTMTQTTVPR